MHNLTNKTVLVVGASRGIGLAIARAIAQAGAHTILAARTLNALEAEADALRKQGFSAGAMRMDVTDPDTISSLPDVDALVNVAGTNIRKPFENYTPEEFDYLFRSNLTGLVHLTQRIGSRMIERGTGGKIIFIGSLTSLLGF